MTKLKQPSEYTTKTTTPSYRQTYLAHEEDVERLRNLTAPHVDSFDYFLKKGLVQGITNMDVAELSIVDPKIVRESPDAIQWSDVGKCEFWVEEVRIAKPRRAANESCRDDRLLPRECRERRLHYAGQLSGTFCYRLVERRNGLEVPGRTHRLAKNFGEIPIMVGSQACHLHKSTPRELIDLREEV